MRDLILVRGAPGSGKSTWIKEHHLEPYTISSDMVRQMFSCPEDDPETGDPHISQRHEHDVWAFIDQIAELRMRMGQFLVIDAQNLQPSRWSKLADKYRYRLWIKQMDTTQEECMERNANRPTLTRVPEHVIMASFWKLGSSQLSIKYKPVPDDVVEGILKPLNIDQYKAVHFMGDIHGCFGPLEKFYNDTDQFKDDELFVFLGDYLDRGLQNKETLELLISLRHRTNVMFLEGNHLWETLWAQDRVDEIKSSEFFRNTMPQLDGVDKKAVREWASRWIQLAYLEYRGKRFFVTHAGLGYLPEHIRWMPTRVYTRGGAYEDDVDRWWCEKCYGPDLIQVHGHRNWYGYRSDETDTSINLNAAVEFGEDWRVLSVYGNSKDVTFEYRYYPNMKHRTDMSPWREEAILKGDSKATPEERVQILVKQLRNTKGINEKWLNLSISSFNFSRDVFYSVAWDDLHRIARGLFIDTLGWKILARGYVKFFNYDEKSFNSKQWLKANLQFPVLCYRKYNGFLAMVAWDRTNERLFIASKSTDESTHASFAKEILEKYADMAEITKYLQSKDVTMLFEICTHKDPHIIKEPERPVLLDIVENDINFKKVPYEELNTIATKCKLEMKKLDSVVSKWEELEPMLDSNWVCDLGYAVEGWVVTDAEGYNFKLKCDYYRIWKRLRTIMEHIRDGKNDINPENFTDQLMKKIVQYMVTLQESGELADMSIIDVRDSWLRIGGEDFSYKPMEANNG